MLQYPATYLTRCGWFTTQSTAAGQERQASDRQARATVLLLFRQLELPKLRVGLDQLSAHCDRQNVIGDSRALIGRKARDCGLTSPGFAENGTDAKIAGNRRGMQGEYGAFCKPHHARRSKQHLVPTIVVIAASSDFDAQRCHRQSAECAEIQECRLAIPPKSPADGCVAQKAFDALTGGNVECLARGQLQLKRTGGEVAQRDQSP